MKITYENQGSYSYMVYEVENVELMDTMCLGMITNNKIPGLAPTIFTQMDGKNFFKYNISSRVTAAQFFEGTVNRKQVLTIFSCFVNALLSAEEYMIGPESFIMDLHYMFVDVGTYDLNLVCLPIIERRKRQFDYFVFFKNIIFSAKFDQSENYDYVGRMINYLNNAVVFSLVEFKQILDSLMQEGNSGQTVGATVFNAMPGVSQSSEAQSGQEAQHQISLSQIMQSANSVQPSQRGYTMPASTVSPVSSTVQTVQPNIAQPQPSLYQPMQPSVSTVQSGVQPVVQPVQQPNVNYFNSTAGQINSSSPTAGNAETGEKKMGLFTLLTHYSKENAALYKEQKNREKGAEASKAPKEAKPAKAAKQSKVSKAPAQGTLDMGFAIPGQDRAPGFSGAAPVQSVTVQQQAVPGNQQAAPAQPASLAAQQGMAQNAPNPSYGTVQAGVGVRNVPQGGIGGRANFGETTILSGAKIGETTVLSAEMEPHGVPRPYLNRLKTGDRVLIDKQMFRIGKENSYVDYFIGDNTAISRSHANIVCREGRYFIVDTNSKNHTFVNGQMIQSNVEVEIQNGAKISLANEEFEFRFL